MIIIFIGGLLLIIFSVHLTALQNVQCSTQWLNQRTC